MLQLISRILGMPIGFIMGCISVIPASFYPLYLYYQKQREDQRSLSTALFRTATIGLVFWFLTLPATTYSFICNTGTFPLYGFLVGFKEGIISAFKTPFIIHTICKKNETLSLGSELLNSYERLKLKLLSFLIISSHIVQEIFSLEPERLPYRPEVPLFFYNEEEYIDKPKFGMNEEEETIWRWNLSNTGRNNIRIYQAISDLEPSSDSLLTADEIKQYKEIIKKLDPAMASQAKSDLKNYKNMILDFLGVTPSFPVTLVNGKVEELYDKENLKKWCIRQVRQRAEGEEKSYERNLTNITGTPLNDLQIRAGYPCSVLEYVQRVRVILEENKECKNNSSQFPMSFFKPFERVYREAKPLFDDKKPDEALQMIPTTSSTLSSSFLGLFEYKNENRLPKRIMGLTQHESVELLTENEIKEYENIVGNKTSERDLRCIQCYLSLQPVRFPLMISDGVQSVLCDRDTLIACLRIKSDFRLNAFPLIPIKDLQIEARYPHTQEIASVIAMVKQTVQTARVSQRIS